MQRRTLALAAAILAQAGAAQAQQFLYTPQPPKGSAYMRFVNAMGGPTTVHPNFLPSQTLGAGTTDRVLAYAVVQHAAGRKLVLDVTSGVHKGHAELTAAPGSFVTIILRPDGDTIAADAVSDDTDFNQTKSHLLFYNATSACQSADLKLLPANATVFAGVTPGAAKARSVNPVTATVVPICGDTRASPVALQGLEAGGMYSIWLMQPSTNTTLSFISRDSTLPYTP